MTGEPREEREGKKEASDHLAIYFSRKFIIEKEEEEEREKTKGAAILKLKVRCSESGQKGTFLFLFFFFFLFLFVRSFSSFRFLVFEGSLKVFFADGQWSKAGGKEYNEKRGQFR